MSLRVEGVSVRFGDTAVLHEVDLEVDDREVVAVLGPSGSGKTTLLRVIAGLQAPTAGRILIDGRDVTGVPTHRRGVGLMFQDHALFPHRDVAGNVAFGLRMARTPSADIRMRVDEVLELVGLAGFRARSIDNLSGGERQRVALARAIAPRPSLLLLDEPLGALDRALRDRLLDELGELLELSGATVIHVTHDQAEAFATGERVVVMREGRVAQVAPPHELWRRPVDARVARIVGPAGIVPVEVDAAGAVRAPWGAIAAGVVEVSALVEEGSAMLVLRPDAVEAVAGDEEEEEGHLVGVVVARAFRGDHVVVRVEVEVRGGPPVEIPVIDRAGAVGSSGSPIALRLVPGAGFVVPLD
ncbi:MAG: ABC transporter ATP-binding protein [Acidimicrobiia bacterium]|nr:ABC transporter ATP-binding protein [Acidimicrobiia bacterium]